MKKQNLLFLLGLLLTSCNSDINKMTIIGSWYNFDKSTNEYLEIHIDDSLFIYIYDDANIILPFDYYLLSDSIFLGNSKNPVIRKYMISSPVFRDDRIILKNKNEELPLIKMDTIIQNLHNTYANIDSLESFSFGYYKRKMIILDDFEK